MKILFICNQNKYRSKTAEDLFKGEYKTKSAGLYNEKPVIGKDILWADVIVVMEEEQRIELGKRFPRLYLQKRILCLDIPDIYGYKQPELETLLRTKMGNLLTTYQIVP